MSTAGIYNYHPKVEHPNSDLYQMESQQPSFYFGGSQIPINLHLDSHGSGFRTPHKFSYNKMKELGDNRKFNKTTIDKYSNIKLPNHMFGLKRI
jgi:hypothetical protein